VVTGTYYFTLNSHQIHVALFLLYIQYTSPGILGAWVNIRFWRIELLFVFCSTCTMSS